MLDILIRGGWVADGTGNPIYPADVAVQNDRVVEVGRLPGATAARVIDAAGKIVCPGFVDCHSHTDSTILVNPTAESTIRQGVTSEVVGNCGGSPAPLSDESREKVGARQRKNGYEGPFNWSSFAEYLEVVRGTGTSCNLAWLVGHGTLRTTAGVSGPSAREEQMRVMEDLVREAMDAGVLGMSTGLEFEPGRTAPTSEIVRLAKVVGERHGMYVSHIRNRDSRLQEAVEECLEIAGAGGARCSVSHLNVRHNTGAADG
ncbi:MAG TPA: amidohydrolase family protein, partial [Chloroflexota bacterium]